MDESMFNLNVQLCEQVNAKAGVINCTSIPLEACSIDRHFQIDSLKPYFAGQNLSTFYCMNADYIKENPAILQGYDDGDGWKYLYIFLNACVNRTDEGGTYYQ